MYNDEITDSHNDLFDVERVDLKHLAAIVMGREIKKIAKRNPKLYERIQHILEKTPMIFQIVLWELSWSSIFKIRLKRM